jgi:hypothetical protein
MNRFCFSVFVLLLLTVSSPVFAVDAEFIWAETDTVGSTLYISQYQDGVWGEKEAIVSNENFNVLPALGSDAFGDHLAVWVVMQNDGRSSLEYSFKRQESWSNPQILSHAFTENLAPVILFDTFNIPWVFWSANNGDNDDIYMTSFSGGTWNQIKKVNDDNSVPDILPKAWLDESGDIVVSWEQLQPDMTYLEVSRKIIDSLSGHTSKFSGIYRKNKTKGVSGQAELISPPPFKINSRATLHFPGKKLLQSSTIRKRIDR